MAWAAPRSGPIDARVSIAGSKSLTNRYLLLAALADTPTVIHYPLVARDTELMAGALQALGARIQREAGTWTVQPGPFRSATINTGLAGTVMRFVPPVAALAEGAITIDGDAQARVRPMGAVVEALRGLGVKVDAAVAPAGPALPITVHGTGALEGGELTIDASASSQFVSALLLAAPRMRRGLVLRHRGTRLPSRPHIEMTLEVLRQAGIDAQSDGLTAWRVSPGVPQLGEISVEPDLSNAGPFLAAAMVTGGTVRVERWPAKTTQPGDAYRGIFARMGGEVRLDGGELTLQGPRVIKPIDIEMLDVGELVPTVAAVAAFANGTSWLRNIGQLRGHETNRLAAITAELAKLGVRAKEVGDDLMIEGQPSLGSEPIRADHGSRVEERPVIETYADHRMATFAAIIGLRVPLEVTDIETTYKTMPNFPNQWHQMIFGGADGA